MSEECGACGRAIPEGGSRDCGLDHAVPTVRKFIDQKAMAKAREIVSRVIIPPAEAETINSQQMEVIGRMRAALYDILESDAEETIKKSARRGLGLFIQEPK